MNPATSVSFNPEVVSRFGFDETIARLTAAIAQEQFLLVHTINTQQILQAHGINVRPVKQLLYFRPDYMERVLKANPAAVIEAPLKFVVAENSAGLVAVRYISPVYLFERYEGLVELGDTLKPIVERIVANIS